MAAATALATAYPYGQWARQFGQQRQRVISAQPVGVIHAPVLILQGDEDGLVSASDSREGLKRPRSKSRSSNRLARLCIGISQRPLWPPCLGLSGKTTERSLRVVEAVEP